MKKLKEKLHLFLFLNILIRADLVEVHFVSYVIILSIRGSGAYVCFINDCFQLLLLKFGQTEKFSLV